MRAPERIAPGPIALFQIAAAEPDRVRFQIPAAAGDTFHPVTWRAHAEAIRELTAFLLAAGLRPGDRCAILAPNRIEWLEAAFAIQAARGVLVPIYPSSTPDQIAHVLGHAGVRFLFSERRVEDASLERTILLGDPEIRARGREVLRTRPSLVEESLAAIRMEDAALMLYTSGTTGRPKGVPLTHSNLVSNTEDWLEAIAPGIPEHAVDLLWLPFSHVFGWGEVGLGNLLGFTSYLVRPDRVMTEMQRVRPSVFMSVPSYWEKLSKLSKERSFAEVTGGRLQFCLSGGAGLDRGVKELFRAQGVLIIEGYGLTETSPTLTINRHDDFRFDSVGKPLSRVEIHLAGDGEIFAKGPNVFAGYYRDPEATANAFTADGWFKTGDVGRFTEDGFLQIIDRKKDILVTSHGKNVPPANIELRFKDDPLIDHVIVYGDSKPFLVAGVWPSATMPGDRAAIETRIESVNRQLASFETIKRFAIMEEPLTVENGMLTATLKPRRKQIYERFRARFEELYA